MTVRWWMWVIAVVVGVGVVVSLVRHRPRAVGAELVQAMEAKGATLRPALMVFDYQVEESVDPLEGVEVQRGTGGVPGGLQADAGQRWMVWRGGREVRGGEFVWRMVKEMPLRAGLGGEADKAVVRGLHRMGYYDEAVRGAIREARGELDGMTDEGLFMAWARADRAVMGEAEALPRAVREGLLLVARRNGGPVVAFRVGDEAVYLLPADEVEGGTGSGEDTWVMLEGYEGGRMVWAGTLRLVGHPAPGVVQAIAAREAREAVLGPATSAP